MADSNLSIIFWPGRPSLANVAAEREAIGKAELERWVREIGLVAREGALDSAVSADSHKYQRIEDHHDSRILVLNAGHQSSPLAGRLEDLKVLAGRSRRDRYTALSYVWGEPRLSDVILIDGKRLAITQSLGDALRSLRPRAAHSPLRIWVDQICINQGDMLERGRQVGLMHAIFKNAGRIFVWLGADASGHATKAFQLVGALHAIFDDGLLSSLCKDAGADFDWIPSKHWLALAELCDLPWFRRAWIPQEIGTDTHATVHWGSETICWNTLHGAMKKLEGSWDLRKRHKINTTSVTVLYKRFVELPPEAAEDKAQRSFVYQLCLSARNQATEPRDYVFSQLGHHSAWIESDQALIMQPDYRNSVADVYHEIAIKALTKDPTLALLNAVSVAGKQQPALLGSPELPSWVPRWDAGRLDSLIGYPGRYRASGSSRSGVSAQGSFEDEFRTLIVSGLKLDTIGKMTDEFTSHCFTIPNPPENALVQSAWCLYRTATDAQPADWGRDPAKFSTQGNCAGDETTPALAAFLDTLAPARLIAALSPPGTAAYHSGIGALEQLFPSTGCFSSEYDPRRLAPEAGIQARPAAWLRAAEEHAVGRRLAVTAAKAYLVMAPPTARAGDAVCVLLGGETPFVLRPEKGGTYSFVGEAYVHGLMEDVSGLFDGEETKSALGKFRIT